MVMRFGGGVWVLVTCGHVGVEAIMLCVSMYGVGC